MLCHIPTCIWGFFFLWEHFLTGLKPHFHAQAYIHTETVYTVYPRSSFYLTTRYSKAHWWVSHHYTTKHCARWACRIWHKATRARNLRINAEKHHYPMPPSLCFSAQETNQIFSLFWIADPKTFPRRHRSLVSKSKSNEYESAFPSYLSGSF